MIATKSRRCLHVKSHIDTSFILVRVVNFITPLPGRHKYWHRDDGWTKTIMAFNEVLLLRRFESVFRCCSVCETMEDYKQGYLMVWANYMSSCNSIAGLYFESTCTNIFSRFYFRFARFYARFNFWCANFDSFSWRVCLPSRVQQKITRASEHTRTSKHTHQLNESKLAHRKLNLA